MEMEKSTYSYRYRPTYGLKSMMIEFLRGDDREELFTDFIRAIEPLNPTVNKLDDNWMVGEIFFYVNTNAGQFRFSMDDWGGVFIDANKELLLKIHELLQVHPDFESVPVDEQDFVLKDKKQ